MDVSLTSTCQWKDLSEPMVSEVMIFRWLCIHGTPKIITNLLQPGLRPAMSYWTLFHLHFKFVWPNLHRVYFKRSFCFKRIHASHRAQMCKANSTAFFLPRWLCSREAQFKSASNLAQGGEFNLRFASRTCQTNLKLVHWLCNQGGFGGTIIVFSREINGIALKDFIVGALGCGGALIDKSLMVVVSSSVAMLSK